MVRTIIRSDWKVRSGHVDKVAHMVVTPAVTVRFSFAVRQINYICVYIRSQLYLGLCLEISQFKTMSQLCSEKINKLIQIMEFT